MLRILLAVCLLTSATHTVSAFELSEYYSAKVLVSSQSRQERQRAASEGLKDVLLRISGSQDVLLNERLFGALDAAISYVDQFQYRPIEAEEGIDGDFLEEITLSFSPRVIDKLLRDAKQRFWPVNRPKTLVWLVEDNIEYGRQLLNEQNDLNILPSLKDIAWERGVPLVFPFLDLDDNIALPAEKAWRFDEQAIREASERYDADVILIGRYLVTSRGAIRSTWQYMHGDTTRIYDYDAQSVENGQMENLARQVLYPLADYLAGKYSIQPRSASEYGLVMLLEGINSFGDYRQALDYLNGLAAIESVKLTSIKQGSMLLTLNTETGIERLQNTFELDKKMRSNSQEKATAWHPYPLGSRDNPIQYFWN